MKRLLRVLILGSFVVVGSPLSALSQGIQQSPYSAADTVGRGAQSTNLDLAPSNPLGMPGSSLLGPRSSENISISSGMFQGIMPEIPNLQIGYNYTFGPQIKAGTASVDYLLPFKIDAGTTVYGEAHGEFQTLSIVQPGSPNNSTELCFGGGYRRMLSKHTMVGLHSFYNTAKLSGTWYPSGSAGVEFASMISGHDAIDLIFNWYGKALDATIFGGTPAYATTAATANFGNANFDFQAGYSHELYNGGPDFRLSATGYKLECGSNVYGYYAGAELKSRDGMYVVKYDVGYDNAFTVYQSVAAFVNMGFQLENILEGKSPFVKPKPVFQSPRNMTTLTQAKPNRNWKHTTQAATSAVVGARASNCLCNQTITVYNRTGHQITLYMNFQMNGQTTLGGYTLPDSFPGWTLYNNAMVTTTLSPVDPTTGQGGELVINFPCTQGYEPVAISADGLPDTPCAATNFEINMCNWNSGLNTYQDTYDISLNAGFNYSGEIMPDSGPAAIVCCACGNSTNPYVYPSGCPYCMYPSTANSCPCASKDSECKQFPPDNSNPPTICQKTINSTNYKLYIGGVPPDVGTNPQAYCPLSTTNPPVIKCP
jgi:hypothetical protein